MLGRCAVICADAFVTRCGFAVLPGRPVGRTARRSAYSIAEACAADNKLVGGGDPSARRRLPAPVAWWRTGLGDQRVERYELQVLIMTNDLIDQPNISALAREHGVSRATIRRRLANGWQPPITVGGEIVQSNQVVATHGQGAATQVETAPGRALAAPLSDGHEWPPCAAIPGHRWRAAGRTAIGLAVAGCGVAIAVTSIRANAWFGRSLTTDPAAGEIFSNLSVLAEIMACIIPMAIALTVVFFAASGFA
jgi:hypothetical protein